MGESAAKENANAQGTGVGGELFALQAGLKKWKSAQSAKADAHVRAVKQHLKAFLNDAKAIEKLDRHFKLVSENKFEHAFGYAEEKEESTMGRIEGIQDITMDTVASFENHVEEIVTQRLNLLRQEKKA